MLIPYMALWCAAARSDPAAAHGGVTGRQLRSQRTRAQRGLTWRCRRAPRRRQPSAKAAELSTQEELKARGNGAVRAAESCAMPRRVAGGQTARADGAPPRPFARSSSRGSSRASSRATSSSPPASASALGRCGNPSPPDSRHITAAARPDTPTRSPRGCVASSCSSRRGPRRGRRTGRSSSRAASSTSRASTL